MVVGRYLLPILPETWGDVNLYDTQPTLRRGHERAFRDSTPALSAGSHATVPAVEHHQAAVRRQDHRDFNESC